MGINRNIVECKSFQLNERGLVGEDVLIETLWNVNSIHQSIPFAVLYRINRNIVECKS